MRWIALLSAAARRGPAKPLALGVGVLVLGAGCPGPSAGVDPTTTAGTTDVDYTTSSSTASTAATGSTTAAPDGITNSSSSTTDDSVGVGFILDPDCCVSPLECSVIEQDCPPGEKCNAWANDGGNAWNATRCFPLDRDPDAVGEPCTVEGSGVSGIDSCDVGSICWDVDLETNQGRCMPYCSGSESTPVCDDPNRWCWITESDVLSLCVPYCDPLNPTLCSEGQGCYPDEGHFVCAPDVSGKGGGPFEPCRFANACDPGLGCIDDSCTPYCDLSAPDCPLRATCVPFFAEGMMPPGYEDVGFCDQP